MLSSSVVWSSLEPSKSVRQEAVGKGTPQSGAVAGASGFTDAQLEAIGGLVEGLLEKALSKARGQSSTGDESGPSQGSSDGDSGKSLLIRGAEVRGGSGNTLRSTGEVGDKTHVQKGRENSEKGVAAGTQVSALPSPYHAQVGRGS